MKCVYNILEINMTPRTTVYAWNKHNVQLDSYAKKSEQPSLKPFVSL